MDRHGQTTIRAIRSVVEVSEAQLFADDVLRTLGPNSLYIRGLRGVLKTHGTILYRRKSGEEYKEMVVPKEDRAAIFNALTARGMEVIYTDL